MTKHKATLEISWTQVIPRTTTVQVKLTEEELEDISLGYGYSDAKWIKAVRKELGDGEDVEFLHDEVDHIEIEEAEDG